MTFASLPLRFRRPQVVPCTWLTGTRRISNVTIAFTTCRLSAFGVIGLPFLLTQRGPAKPFREH
jgi:hypothetical protein